MAACAVAIGAGCTGTERASVPPSFDAIFEALTGPLMTRSSPALRDLTGDGVPDIVFGTGTERTRPENGRYVLVKEPEVPGGVVAVSGATNELLWSAPHPGDAFTTPRFAELNGDGVPDVVMGGREGAFAAVSGTDGARLWRVAPADVATTPVPYNFFTPAVIEDVSRDGVVDLIVVHGGNDLRLPNEPRDPSFLAVISGADGKVLAVHPTPDGNESYSALVVYERPDGEPWLIFGTGGETHGGAAYRAPVASLLDGTFASRVERLIEPGPAKGVIAPATLVELTGDDELDVVLTAFDGRLTAVDGATGKSLWKQGDEAEGEETYHSAAVGRIGPDGRLGLFVSRGIGAFPRYVGTAHRLYDAVDGRVLFEQKDPFYPGGAPLAVGLEGDGRDEWLFFSQRYPTAQGGRIYIRSGATNRVLVHDVPTNFGSTPVIADPRDTGALELIGLSWHLDDGAVAPSWRNMTWQLLRLDLGAPSPASPSWAAYMGTRMDGRYDRGHPERSEGSR